MKLVLEAESPCAVVCFARVEYFRSRADSLIMAGKLRVHLAGQIDLI